MLTANVPENPLTNTLKGSHLKYHRMSSRLAMNETAEFDVFALYREYDAELRELAAHMRKQYHLMQERNCSAGISDVEGELLYLLLRETRPETVFEISPDTGWSTNYILAALTANSTGTLHSFEIQERKRGRPTEQVIRENQCFSWDQQRLFVHIGDAVETTQHVAEPINFLFIDSCHEDWYAQWYIDVLLPQVRGLVWTEDVAFSDQLENSSEGHYVWTWIEQQHVPIIHCGALEATLQDRSIRTGYPRRRPSRGNAICFSWPPNERGSRPALARGPSSMITLAEQEVRDGHVQSADRLLNEAADTVLRTPERAVRHRELLRIGLCYSRLGQNDEAKRCFRQALAVAIQEDYLQRTRKFYPEVLRFYLTNRQWSLACKVTALMLLDSSARRPMLQVIQGLSSRFVRGKLRAVRNLLRIVLG